MNQNTTNGAGETKNPQRFINNKKMNNKTREKIITNNHFKN